MLHSDRPINRPADDLFGRADFALSLARSIDRMQVARDGFVIAIQGEWGSGKTSVIELVRRYLLHIEMERASQTPLLLDDVAVPKTIAELDKMADIFAPVSSRILAMELLDQDVTQWEHTNRLRDFNQWLSSPEDVAAVDHYWQLKIRAEARRRTIIVPFSPWLISGKVELASALLSELARALGAPLGDDVKYAFGAMLTRLSEFAPVAGAGLDLATGGIGGGILRAGGNWSSKLARNMTSGPTLDQLRNRLRKSLSDLQHQRVLVIVDDLDRLTPAEALEMVSLVKSLGDLPNVVYLLSYDQPKLAKLLQHALKSNGHEFLEKIVQYQVDLPPFDETDLLRLLNSDLASLLPDISREESDALGTVWHYTLRPYLRTPRAVRRFVNALSVKLPTLVEYTNIFDLIILEVLRIFEPELYNFIRRELSELVD